MIARLTRIVALALIVSGFSAGAAMAQTQLVSFPAISRSGVQQSPWGTMPLSGDIDSIQMVGTATDAVFADPTNQITFIVLARDPNDHAHIVPIQVEYWYGGQHFDKGTMNLQPNRINTTFGPLAAFAGWDISLQATFNQPIVIGATLSSKPPQVP